MKRDCWWWLAQAIILLPPSYEPKVLVVHPSLYERLRKILA
jgi:hypothetical protein